MLYTIPKSKKQILIGFAAVLASCSVFASNTVQFEGNLTASTCDVRANNAENPVVLLPAVQASQVTGGGTKAAETPFRITVTGCPAAGSLGGEVKVTFTANGTVSLGGHLMNTVAPAQGGSTGVFLLIHAAPNGLLPINLRTPWVSPDGQGISLPAYGTQGSRDYYVSYLGQGNPVNPGRLRASMQYGVTYP